MTPTDPSPSTDPPSPPGSRPPAGSVDEVLDLYRRWGADRYDEAVSQLDHGLQCAALAEVAGAPDALVVAALLHDVGHLLHLDAQGGGGPADDDLAHEAVGAAWLAELYGPEVTGPIALHVAAKRFLCATDAAHREALSAGSRRSLGLQGGPMTDGQAAVFRHEPGAEAAVALRRWDDAGKVDGLVVPALDHHRARLEALASRR